MPDSHIDTSGALRSLILRQVHLIRKRPCTPKTLVILALGLRATRLNEALIILSHSGFRDEAAALLRIVIEVVVNGAYLMVTGEKEFMAFTAHPVVLMGKHHLAYLEHSGGQNPFTKELNELVATGAAEAAAISGRTAKDSSWTSESVYKRAAIVDKVFNNTDFSLLAETSYVDGHAFIHGNFHSIVDIIGELEGEDLSKEEIHPHQLTTLRHAPLALLGYALAVDQHFKTCFHAELGQIILRYANAEGSVST